MNNRKSKLPMLLVLLGLIIVVVVLCVCIHFANLKENALVQNEPDGVTDTLESMTPDEIAKVSESIKVVFIDEPYAGAYECPKPLSDAIRKNPDVYAWLSVTGTNISYPICNRPLDNRYYLNHSSEPAWNPMGALYTEDYNKRDFSDNCVVVYGHSMTGTKFFGTLQKDYSDKTFFDEHREIKVYLPDKVLTYKVFAAVPYTNVHILYYFDFTSKSYYNWFIESVTGTRSIEAIVDSDSIPEYDEKLLILSTCLKGYNNKRFLVLSVLTDTEVAENNK